jgi:hypothetical protein
VCFWEAGLTDENPESSPLPTGVEEDSTKRRSTDDISPLTGLGKRRRKAKLISVAIVSQFPPQESAPAWPRQFLQ